MKMGFCVQANTGAFYGCISLFIASTMLMSESYSHYWRKFVVRQNMCYASLTREFFNSFVVTFHCECHIWTAGYSNLSSLTTSKVKLIVGESWINGTISISVSCNWCQLICTQGGEYWLCFGETQLYTGMKLEGCQDVTKLLFDLDSFL